MIIMRNIIILLGGLGSRFEKNNYKRPKPLVNINGKPMINYLLDKLTLYNDNIFIVLKRDLEKYNFSQSLNKFKNIHYIYLDENTGGAAETLLKGLQKTHEEKLLNNGNIICFDSDTHYTIDILSKIGDNPGVISFIDNGDLPIYSYNKINENDEIIEIIEKEKISFWANSGCYILPNYEKTIPYIQRMLRDEIKQKSEYYISSLINLMIKEGEKFILYKINKTDFNITGTPIETQLFSLKNESISKYRFCFDLDNTLVTSPEIEGDYSSCKLIEKNIQILRFLKNHGHTIIIYTARRMRTHHGNLGKVIADIGELTINFLKINNIPFDEIYFGKPYSHFYIDDLAINAIYDDIEKEIGFYMNEIPPRSFNNISYKDKIVRKSTNNKIGDKKLDGEIYFYKNIPKNFIKYFPRLLNVDVNNCWYEMEKINGINFSLFYLKELLTPNKLIELLEILKELHLYKSEEEVDIYGNYTKKLLERLKDFKYSYLPNYNKKLSKIILKFDEYERNNLGIKGLIHGDPVFTNIIMDENCEFKFFDMRGKIGNKITIFGDIFYDYGKILQSLLGYDEILNDKYVKTEYKILLINTFNNWINQNYPNMLEYIYNITNSLLLSLIPLHDNNKVVLYYNLINF